MIDNLIKRSWFTICRRLFNGCNVEKTSCTTGHLTFLKRSQLAGCRWTNWCLSTRGHQQRAGWPVAYGFKIRLYRKISKLIHFPKNNMKRRYVLTVFITSHTWINNEIHNWLTDGHLTRMGPRLIMNICLIFPDPVFSHCKVANSELLLHNHTCAQLSYCFETSSRQVFHCGGKQCSI